MAKTYDPVMHSAEHLLNQAMVRRFGCGRCFSAHINKKKSKCDYRFDRNPSSLEIKEIEDQVNQVIEKDLPVLIELLSWETAGKEFNLERIPGSGDADTVRIVRMGTYDACPCIGPHVSSTGKIGSFRIISSDYEAGVLRIRFRLD